MDAQAMRDEFEEVHSRLYPQDKSTRLPNGNYSGWVKQQHWQDFQVSYKHRESSNVELTEEEQQEFIHFISRWSVRCEFEGQQLIVPPGQGHSVGLAVRTAFEAWKYQIKKARHQGQEQHEQTH